MGIHVSGISIPLSLLMFLGRSLMWIPSLNLRVYNVPMRITIKKHYFVPKWVVSGVVSMFCNGGGLGTGKSDVSFMFFDSVLHRFSSLTDEDLNAFTGNPVNHAILFNRLDSIFRWTRCDLNIVSDWKQRVCLVAVGSSEVFQKRSAICAGVNVVWSTRLGSSYSFCSVACTAALIGPLERHHDFVV